MRATRQSGFIGTLRIVKQTRHSPYIYRHCVKKRLPVEEVASDESDGEAHDESN